MAISFPDCDGQSLFRFAGYRPSTHAKDRSDILNADRLLKWRRTNLPGRHREIGGTRHPFFEAGAARSKAGNVSSPALFGSRSLGMVTLRYAAARRW